MDSKHFVFGRPLPYKGMAKRRGLPKMQGLLQKKHSVWSLSDLCLVCERENVT